MSKLPLHGGRIPFAFIIFIKLPEGVIVETFEFVGMASNPVVMDDVDILVCVMISRRHCCPICHIAIRKLGSI